MKVLSWLWALWLLLLLWPNRSAFEDVRSLVALNGDYATAEEFIKWDYDLRIQKIRTALSGACRPTGRATWATARRMKTSPSRPRYATTSFGVF